MMQRGVSRPAGAARSLARFFVPAVCAALARFSPPAGAALTHPSGTGTARFAILPLAGRVFVVDPGHGGIDGGCSAAGYLEKNVVLPIGLELTKLLREAGARVGLTRSEDMELGHMNPGPGSRHRRDLAARVAVARRLGPDLMISLHVNASAGGRLRGAIVFYPPGRVVSRHAALRLLNHLRPILPGNQNAVLPADLYVLRHVPYPVVLVELGFLTHPDDRAVLTSPDGQRSLAGALYAGIADHFADEARSLEEPSPWQGAPVMPRLLMGPSPPKTATGAVRPVPAETYGTDLCPEHERP